MKSWYNNFSNNFLILPTPSGSGTSSWIPVWMPSRKKPSWPSPHPSLFPCPQSSSLGPTAPARPSPWHRLSSTSSARTTAGLFVFSFCSSWFFAYFFYLFWQLVGSLHLLYIFLYNPNLPSPNRTEEVTCQTERPVPNGLGWITRTVIPLVCTVRFPSSTWKMLGVKMERNLECLDMLMGVSISAGKLSICEINVLSLVLINKPAQTVVILCYMAVKILLMNSSIYTVKQLPVY